MLKDLQEKQATELEKDRKTGSSPTPTVKGGPVHTSVRSCGYASVKAHNCTEYPVPSNSFKSPLKLPALIAL